MIPTESTVVGLSVKNRVTGEEEAVIEFGSGEVEMQGYVEHVERGYEGTPWYTERIHAEEK